MPSLYHYTGAMVSDRESNFLLDTIEVVDRESDYLSARY